MLSCGESSLGRVWSRVIGILCGGFGTVYRMFGGLVRGGTVTSGGKPGRISRLTSFRSHLCQDCPGGLILSHEPASLVYALAVVLGFIAVVRAR